MTFEPEEAEVVDAPDPTKPAVPAHDYRLAGDRRLAQGWKARAKDNLAAIRLMTAIEAEARHARPDEQEQPGEIHGLRRHGPRRPPLSPRRRRLRPRMGRSRPRARRARFARGSRKSQAGDAIRAFHAGVHDPRHLAGAQQDGLRRRARARARLRNGPLLRPRAGSACGQARADRRRDGRCDRPDRKAPLSERPHPARGFHQGAASGRLRPRDRQPAVLGPHRARRRSGRRAPPFPARLFHRALDRAAEARRPRRVRHLALDHGQGRPDQPASISRPWRT